MKKIRIVKEKIEERFCDECGKPASHQCHFCYKDLCGYMSNKCAVQDDNDDSDDPDYYCKKCWKIGEPYREKIDELHIEEWRLEEVWEKEAKKK